MCLSLEQQPYQLCDMSSLLIVCFQDELLRAAFCYEVSATDQGPGIRLTVHGKQRSVTVKEMSMMSLDVFAAIWSVCDCPMHCFASCTDLLVFACGPIGCMTSTN